MCAFKPSAGATVRLACVVVFPISLGRSHFGVVLVFIGDVSLDRIWPKPYGGGGAGGGQIFRRCGGRVSE